MRIEQMCLPEERQKTTQLILSNERRCQVGNAMRRQEFVKLLERVLYKAQQERFSMMRVGSFSGICATVLLCSIADGAEQKYGNWTIRSGQGYLERGVRSEPNSYFVFSCDEFASSDGEPKKTGIVTEIKVGYPPPRSKIDVFVDGTSFQLSTNELGLAPANCRICSQTFAALWIKVRASKQMVVSLADGRSATFQLNGAAKALPPKPCSTGFLG